MKFLVISEGSDQRTLEFTTFCCPTQVGARSLWVKEVLSGRCQAVPLTLLKQHHQSSISCHSPKLRSEQIHVNRKGHILPCAFTQLDSLLLTLCQETAIPLYTPLWMTEPMRRSPMTSSTPPSPCHLSRTTTFHYAVKCLDYKTDLSRMLSGELTRNALVRQSDVALCHHWHVSSYMLLSKWHSSLCNVISNHT